MSTDNITIKNNNIVQILRDRAYSNPDKDVFLYIENTNVVDKVNYKNLDIHASAVANTLNDMNAIKHSAILLFEPGIDFIKAFMGCLYSSVKAVPLQLPSTNQDSLNKVGGIIINSGAKVILTTSKTKKKLISKFSEEAKDINIPILSIDEIKETDIPSIYPIEKIDPNKIAFLQYTSGSTGNPKGVMVSHDNIMKNQAMIKEAFSHDENLIVCGWLPHYHDMGLIGNILQTIYVGGQAYLMSPFEFISKPVRWLQSISKFKATTCGGPNFAFDHCVNRIKPEALKNINLESWKVAMNGAEPVQIKTLKSFCEKFSQCGFREEMLFPTYGLAEATLFVTAHDTNQTPKIRFFDKNKLLEHEVVEVDENHPSARGLVSLGHTWGNEKIAICFVLENKKVEKNKVGEICVSGAHIAKGYWNNVIETDKTFNIKIEDDYYLRTGDAGFLVDGELYISSRIKEAIILNGKNHAPHDIEHTISLLADAFKGASCAAFSMPSDLGDQLCIVQEINRRHIKTTNYAELSKKIKHSVNSEHGISTSLILFVSQRHIPKTSSGKIRRNQSRKLLLNGRFKSLHIWKSNQYKERDFNV